MEIRAARTLLPWVVGLGPADVMLLRASLGSLCDGAVVAADRMTVTELGLALPDVLVIDLDNMASDPLEMLRMTRFVLPACLIAVYSGTLERRWALSCHLAGANCMLAKRSDAGRLRFALERMLDDGCFTDPNFLETRDVVGDRSRSTERVRASSRSVRFGASMSKLTQHIVVTCPPAQAAMRLRHYFAANKHGDEGASRLVLGVTLDDSPGVRSLGLSRSVIATVVPHHLAADMAPRYAVTWKPEVSGPFPTFEGELVVDGTDDYGSFALRLEGRYTPPLGVLGQGFDAVVGHRIAERTAANLLRMIAEDVERGYAHDEASKPTKSG